MISGVVSTLKNRGFAVMVKAVINGIIWNFYKKVLGKKYIEKNIHNYRMRLDLNDRGISRTLVLFGTREVEHKVMLDKVLKEGMKVFDIGANIGYYANMELKLLQRAENLLAIEPSPRNIELLKYNLSLNGFSETPVICGAVSDKAGKKEFFLSEQTNLNTFHNVGTGIDHLSGESIEVETFVLPDLIDKYFAPDLIRMDVEGHEVEVLNGLIPAIEAGKAAPMVLFETHLTRYTKEHDMEAVLKKMFELGYKVKMAASSSQSGTEKVNALGYSGSEPIVTDDVERVIYENIKDEDAIKLICFDGGFRTVLLAKE